jgi:hypothetical protein
MCVVETLCTPLFHIKLYGLERTLAPASQVTELLGVYLIWPVSKKSNRLTCLLIFGFELRYSEWHQAEEERHQLYE